MDFMSYSPIKPPTSQTPGLASLIVSVCLLVLTGFIASFGLGSELKYLSNAGLFLVVCPLILGAAFTSLFSVKKKGWQPPWMRVSLYITAYGSFALLVLPVISAGIYGFDLSS